MKPSIVNVKKGERNRRRLRTPYTNKYNIVQRESDQDTSRTKSQRSASQNSL